ATLLPFSEKSITSALSRWAASSKLVRVRVLFSQNALTTTRPRSAGTFLMLRVETSLNVSAVSRMTRISSADSSSSPNRWRRVQSNSFCVSLLIFLSTRPLARVSWFDDDAVLVVIFDQLHLNPVVFGDG